MKIQCHSRITRVLKTRKNHSIWPEILAPDCTNWDKLIPNTGAEEFPRCEGEIDIVIRAEHDGHCGDVPYLNFEWVCTKCNNPYVPNFHEINRVRLSRSWNIELSDLLSMLGVTPIRRNNWESKVTKKKAVRRS